MLLFIYLIVWVSVNDEEYISDTEVVPRHLTDIHWGSLRVGSGPEVKVDLMHGRPDLDCLGISEEHWVPLAVNPELSGRSPNFDGVGDPVGQLELLVASLATNLNINEHFTVEDHTASLQLTLLITHSPTKRK